MTTNLTSERLNLAPGLELGLDLVTKTLAILAQRRKGKTYTAKLLAEEFVGAGVPWVAIDPTGAWWGLKASADGTGPGLPVIVLGGQHGDAPLDRHMGRAVADLVLDSPAWYVLDLSIGFESRAAERQFATDFADRLYRRKGEPGMDFALHLFVDEADMFVPQEKESGDQRMLGAFQAIVRRGGIRGLGCTLISQRPALVNKNVLTQLDLLILLRLVAGNDQDAVFKNYIQRAGSKEAGVELMGSLASLGLGEGWVWEPGADPPLYERVHFRAARTFNSSATPKPGEKRIEPTTLAKVDLSRLQSALADAIDRAQSEDPAFLRRRIADLEAQLRDRPEPEAIVELVPQPYVPDEVWDHIAAIEARVVAEIAKTRETLARLPTRDDQPPAPPKRADVVPARPLTPKKAAAPAIDLRRLDPKVRAEQDAAKANGQAGASKLGKKVLEVLALYPETTRRSEQIALLTGNSVSGHFRNTMGDLRAKGLVEGTPQAWSITAAGLAVAGNPPPLPRGRELLDFWLAHPKVGKAHQEILTVLYEQRAAARRPGQGAELTSEEVAAATPSRYEVSGHFRNTIGALRRIGLIHGKPSGWWIDEAFFE